MNINIFGSTGIIGSKTLNIINPKIVTKRKGGEGAFREFVDRILARDSWTILIEDLLG